MARYTYERLSALDHSFLVLEKSNAYMHVASTQVHEVGPLARPDGGIDAEAIKELTAGSLQRIPRYRQKLAYIPIENRPVWVDDHNFNIDYHVRHTSLPRPGTDEQLKRLSARIMQQHLDRDRPLWEMWVVEGLERGRFALVSKVHHSMIDGVAGVDLMRILMSTTAEQPIPEAHRYIARPNPSRRVTLPWRTLRDARAFFREARDVRRDITLRLRALTETLGATLRFPSQTPLNHPIGPHRRFDWMATELSEIKAIRRQFSGTVNDVVLTVVTGAVRRFLQQRGVDPRKIEFRVMAPVSVRTEDEQGAFGNRISVWLVDLPIAQADPRKQLKWIAKRTAELKESKQATAAEVLTQVAEWTPSNLLALGARNVTRLLPFNMVVTNVPGPQIPMYMVGARMLEVYPHVPLVDNLGLGIALMSYDGKLFWGLNADYDLVPDLADFVSAIRDSFQEVRRLAMDVVPAVQRRGAKTPENPAASSQSVGNKAEPVKRSNGPTPTP
jgi:WS/DGAT/MGAT family acyltransferase